uniref:SHSP domain-containing protein n=1 Tax=Pygocentrus nattereri TaxID=42514 RepID=A0A3B4CU32_PYGNA
MLCLYRLQPSVRQFMDIPWPVFSLWPDVVPLYHHRHALLKNMQGIETTLELLEKPENEIFEKVSQTTASDVVQQVSYAVEKEGGGFALSIHAKDFSPEIMSIKQVGRTLHICGKTEKREEDGEGSYSHRVQEFRREFLLPEGVNPEALSCSLAEGKLFIQTPKTQQSEKPDRLLTIDGSQADEIQFNFATSVVMGFICSTIKKQHEKELED